MMLEGSVQKSFIYCCSNKTLQLIQTFLISDWAKCKTIFSETSVPVGIKLWRNEVWEVLDINYLFWPGRKMATKGNSCYDWPLYEKTPGRLAELFFWENYPAIIHLSVYYHTFISIFVSVNFFLYGSASATTTGLILTWDIYIKKCF